MRLFFQGLAVWWLIGGTAVARNEYPVPVAASPAWILQKDIDVNFKVPHEEISRGVYFLLADTQVHVPERRPPEYFYHYAQHIVNETGVKESAQIDIDYNPVYQSLVLHEIAVRRDGKKLDKLATARMNLINREKELDQLLYFGEKTLHLILDDIRVGDTLEYSFSKNGDNPIYEGIFAFDHSAEWSVPLRYLSIIVNWHKPAPLYRQFTGKGYESGSTPVAGGTRYVLEKKDLKSLILDENTPYWFDPYAMLRFSESGNWESVAAWARPLMESAVSGGPEIATIAERIAAETPDAGDRIAAALQYVQSEVRYFGIEIGENSHRPAKAEDTLARRYGDCKDKTVLLVSLLRALGIEAYAALVNSRMKSELRHVLPALNVFDHVIVSVRHEGKVYWFDPTRQYQHGGLGAIHQPDFGYALVLSPDVADLTEAGPRHQAPLGSILHETFDLSAGIGAPVPYTSHTTATGLNAERIRRDLAIRGLNKLQNDYLNFYKEYYPSIRVAEPAVFRDDPELNRMESEEKYSIDTFWEEDAKNNKDSAMFYANSITTHLKKAKGERRIHPLELEHPVNIRHRMEIKLTDSPWNLDDEDFTEDNPFFSYSEKVRFHKSANKLELEYSYASKADSVPPENFDDYIKTFEKLDGHDRYGIYIKRNSTPAGSAETEPNYALYGVILYFAAFVLIFASWRVHQHKRPFTGDMIYYPVSLLKFAVLWTCTFGVYGIYWFYRNWLYVKQRDQSSIMPVARGIFNLFWYYPLYEDLGLDSARRFQRSHLPGPAVAIALAVLFLIANLASNHYSVASTLVCMLLMLPLVNYINFANRDNQPALRHNSQWHPRHALLVLLSIPLLLLVQGSETGLLPADTAVEGETLMGHDVKFLQRKGVIRPDDEIRYFYSAGLLSVREDGNGFSDRHVFSYWKDDGRFFLESATFDAIKDINVTWGKEDKSTIVEIVGNDDKRFNLYVSTSEKKDKLFVDSLLARWKPADSAINDSDIR